MYHIFGMQIHRGPHGKQASASGVPLGVDQPSPKVEIQPVDHGYPWVNSHWIGLRENLQETMVFTIKYRGFL